MYRDKERNILQMVSGKINHLLSTDQLKKVTGILFKGQVTCTTKEIKKQKTKGEVGNEGKGCGWWQIHKQTKEKGNTKRQKSKPYFPVIMLPAKPKHNIVATYKANVWINNQN